MSNPALQPIFNQILTDPKALTTLIATIVTIVIAAISFILNYALYHSRVNEQRDYESEWEFYKITVLSSINEFVGFGNYMKTSYDSLKREIKNIPNGTKRRGLVEKYSDDIDKKHSYILYNILPIVKGYSQELALNIETIAEKLLDDITNIFSKYDRSVNSEEKDTKYRSQLTLAITNYVEKLFSNIREYKPKN